MLELFEFHFFQNAFLAALFVSIACGLVGSLMMVNRLFSMAGGITHGAFGGIGIAFYFSLPILISTTLFTLLLSLLVAFLTQCYQNRSDNIIAVIWAFGMALGVLLIDLTPGYNTDLMAYLFGSILAVSTLDLQLMFVADLFFILIIMCFYRQFEIVSFDKEFAKTRGIPVVLFYYLLIAMMAFCIVISIRAVGLILVMALLSIPSFIAENITQKLGKVMCFAILLSMIFCVTGLFVSAYWNIATGASIIFAACLGFMMCFLLKKRWR